MGVTRERERDGPLRDRESRSGCLLNVDLLEVTYCEGWNFEAGAAAGPMSTTLAEERDAAGEQYAVLLSAAERPVALIEVARGELHYGLRFFGEEPRFVSEVDCRLLEEDRLFMAEQRLGPLPDDEQFTRLGRKWGRVVSARPGYVQEKEEIAGALRHSHGPADTGEYWVDLPEFGDWGRFIHSFPRALNAAGLDVPATAALFDVSAPDGPGLALGERPWQPSRALAPDPAHLVRLFAAGTRLAYKTTGGLGAGNERIERVTVEVADAGKLRMPSGRVVAKDPTWFTHVDAFTVTVPPGEYSVLLSVVRFAGSPGHTRVAAAKLVIRDEPSETWEMALLPGQDPRLLGNQQFYGFGVDAGTGCFYDDSAAEAFSEIMHDILGGGMSGSMTDPDSGANLIAYHSGWGDGSYPTWIGRDHGGNVTCFVSDMLLMPGSVTAEERL